jgi:predicted O-methyltransferase YrrM
MYLSHDELVLPRVDASGAPTPDNFWHTLRSDDGPRSINGFMGDDWQKHFFYTLGYHTRGTAVELGAFLGLSSVLFALGMKHSPWQQGKLICVDWFQDGYLGVQNMRQRFEENIKAFGVESYITAVQGSCEDPKVIKPTALEWLYLDASHYRKELRVNMEIFGPMVKPGGLYIWHDTHMEEVLLHIEEVKAEQGIVPVIVNRPDFQVWMKPINTEQKVASRRKSKCIA